MTTLKDYAAIIRSKNAGPFYITLEIFFKSPEDYDYVVSKNVITQEILAERYKLEPNQLEVYFCKPVSAIKLTYPRKHYAGGPLDSDVLGAQQHAPLMSIQVDE